VRQKSAAATLTIQVKEEARGTKLEQELAVLVPKVGAAGGKKALVADKYYFLRKKVDFKQDKGILTVALMNKDQSVTISYVQITTGPFEPWFIAGEVPVASADYSPKDIFGGSITPQEQPNELHLSLNYLFNVFGGDVFNPDFEPFVHVFAKLSDSPLESIGAGVGICFPNINGFIDLSSVSLSGNILRVRSNGADD